MSTLPRQLPVHRKALGLQLETRRGEPAPDPAQIWLSLCTKPAAALPRQNTVSPGRCFSPGYWPQKGTILWVQERYPQPLRAGPCLFLM